MKTDQILSELISRLQYLPGVGPKTAQRLAFFMMDGDREKALSLANVIKSCVENIVNCKSCRNFTSGDYCNVCLNQKRNHNLICVVESPLDVEAIESAGIYNGLYFVLFGRLSPLDGKLPDSIGLLDLERRLAEEGLLEIIVATSMTLEGEATAHYLKELGEKYDVLVSRIAHGVPMGGELEYVNAMTLSKALEGRSKL